MPLATKAALEAIVGPRAVAELMAEAMDPNATPDEQQAQAEARLDSALTAGDNLIAQFLPLPEPEESDVLSQFAIDEALYYLRCNTKGGASDSQHIAAQTRRTDLKHMRKREQWPGKAKGQRNVGPRIVESASPFAQDKMGGFT